MKNLFKIITVIIMTAFCSNACFAIQTGKIDKLVKSSAFYDSAIVSVSIKNANSGKVVYELNSNKLLHPASTLKIFTTYMALDTLGYEYLFKTQFYKDNQNNLYIKLGADPLLTSADIKNSLKILKEKGFVNFKNLYIDDSVIDKKEFATGWMWDDDVNPYTPKVSAYNLDGNIVQVGMVKTKDGSVQLNKKTSYPMSVYSYIKSGASQDYIDIGRYNWNNPELVEVYGFVKNPQTLNIPVSSMRRYFIHQLENALEDSRIKVTSTLFASKLVPSNAQLITEINHSIKSVIPRILGNSNNLMAETIFKLAGAKRYSSTGSDILASELFNEFYKNKGLDTKNIIVKDGCGVSRNNLISTDWETSALNKLFSEKGFEEYKDKLAQPGEGTLLNRLINLRGDVWLKTGTLSNLSAVAGYVHSLDGHVYSVSIITQNFNDNPSNIKNFEDEVITLIHNR